MGEHSPKYANSGYRGTSSFNYPCHGMRGSAVVDFQSLAARGNHMENERNKNLSTQSQAVVDQSNPNQPQNFHNISEQVNSVRRSTRRTYNIYRSISPNLSDITEPFSPSTISYTPSLASVDEDPSDHLVQEPPALDVARGENSLLPVSTKTGKPRVRMSWSSEVNIFIMRTYYYITKLETDMTIYRKKLHEHFLARYPDINVSEQRISDQRRAIIKNKYLSESFLNELKKEVQTKLEIESNNENNSTIHTIHRDDTTDTPNIPSSIVPLSIHTLSSRNAPVLQTHIHNTNANLTQPSNMSTQTENINILLENEVECLDYELEINTDPIVQQMYEKLQTTLLLYRGIDPTVRPKLPKLRYSKKLSQLLNLFNEHILNRFLSNEVELSDIHTLVYCTAYVISQELGFKINNDTEERVHRHIKQIKKPSWKVRLEKDIESIRADIGRVTQYINNNRSRKLVQKVEEIFQKLRVHSKYDKNNEKPEEYLDTLKQKLALKSKRLARYNKSLKRKNDNKLFTTNEKNFYRKLQAENNSQDNNGSTEIPSTEELENFWAGIWETESQHKEAEWMIKEEGRWETIEEMRLGDITESDIKKNTVHLHNWKAPGVDKIHNFWYKKLHVLHRPIAKTFTNIFQGMENIPQFVTKGITYMLPKGSHTKQPSKYRPITCLPTIYKILTSVISSRINAHLEQNNILSEEQKGCRKGHMGCKEQLIIDSTIHKHAAAKRRNLHCAYIDYQKAFDSVPHSWLLRVLNIYKIDPKIVLFLQNIMPNWKTSLCLTTQNSKVTSREITIKKGIYQGDSLSPLWFCLALNPLSHLLNGLRVGYSLKHDNTETNIDHLIYMDDIKLYAKTKKDIDKLIETTAKFSNDINMKFGLDKCRTLHIIKGKTQPGGYAISETESIAAMEPNEVYKYLGYVQSRGLDHSEIKRSLQNEYRRRIIKVTKSQLTGKNMIKAINTFCIPILTYSFGVIKWSKTNIITIERMTRTILTKYNYLHPKSAIERMVIKRKNGGRGLINIQALWKKQITTLKTFFSRKAEHNQIHSAIINNDKMYTPLNLTDRQTETEPCRTDYEDENIDEWKRKVLHGRHPNDLQQSHIDLEASNKWLQVGTLFAETEGFLIAIQDQVINTKNYQKYIIKDAHIRDDKCRKCHIHSETIQHITGACPHLTQTDYTHRHNQVANIIHQKLAHKHNLLQTTNKPTPYYEYLPKPVLENNTHKLYYDRSILTDRTIHYNRPDIVLQDKLNKTTYLIDIAVPNTHNLTKTITEKIHKYTDLKDEIYRIWNQDKVFIVPIVLSTTGVIPKHLHNSLKLLNLKPLTYINMQKAAILNTCRIVRKFMDSTDTDTYNINTNYTHTD
ncbi:uncharacterized protein LOC135310067 [Plodia interpunctella]|uniref:uncharacterized protein LOC135309858 n=1 Tax=Plodia interpunctella TaxID=58824 RepID=UPI0031013E15